MNVLLKKKRVQILYQHFHGRKMASTHTHTQRLLCNNKHHHTQLAGHSAKPCSFFLENLFFLLLLSVPFQITFFWGMEYNSKKIRKKTNGNRKLKSKKEICGEKNYRTAEWIW